MAEAPTTMQLDIVSAEASLFQGEIKHMIVTGGMGELGIFPGHTALLTSMKPGQVFATLLDGKEEIFYISGGMLEVQPHAVTVLADVAQAAQDLDEAAVLAAKARAEQLVEGREAGMEYSKALVELAQAMAQLKAIQRLRDTR